MIDTGLLVHFSIFKIVSFKRFYPLRTKYRVGNGIGFPNVIQEGFFPVKDPVETDTVS